jgi:hypothetical protein
MRVEPPRLLLGLPPLKAEFKGELWWTYLEDDKKQKIKQHRGVGLRIGSFNPGLFARMIAKIAHAFTVADQGLNKFRPLLPSVIVGAQTDNLADFIGGDMIIPPAIETLHRLHLEVGWVEGVDYAKYGLPNDVQFLIVHVRLFANLATPQYHVVVGIWNEPRKKNEASIHARPA